MLERFYGCTGMASNVKDLLFGTIKEESIRKSATLGPLAASKEQSRHKLYGFIRREDCPIDEYNGRRLKASFENYFTRHVKRDLPFRRKDMNA